MTPATPLPAKRLIILYGIGGLSDVGRHALQAAMEKPNVHCTVLTQHPELLQESNWKCGCPEPHDVLSFDPSRFQVVKVDSWTIQDGTTTTVNSNLFSHFEGADAVISCLGNRQGGIGGWVAHDGCQVVIRACEEHKIKRVVAITSMGVEEDWPPMEFIWCGKVLALLFLTYARKAFQDLTLMERALRASSLDYLLVRPVGIGEDVKPVGKWFLQKEKYKDALGFDMAKLDVARFMVEEALNPTRHKEAVAIGSEPPKKK